MPEEGFFTDLWYTFFPHERQKDRMRSDWVRYERISDRHFDKMDSLSDSRENDKELQRLRSMDQLDMMVEGRLIDLTKDKE